MKIKYLFSGIKNESGNVLFYILIAVALLAALSYAVSQSSRGGGGLDSLNEEQVKIASTEIIEYANAIANAVTQLKLRGCKDTEISFENSISTLDYINTGDPTGDNYCHVFHVDGGGVTYQNPLPAWLDKTYNSDAVFGSTYFPNRNCIIGIGKSEDTGGSCQLGGDHADLMIIIPFVKLDICNKLNEMAGNNFNSPPVDANMALDSGRSTFRGTYGNPFVIHDTAGTLNQKNSACFEATNNPSGGYIFYKVLLAR